MTYQNTPERFSAPVSSPTTGRSVLQAAISASRHSAKALGNFLRGIGDSYARAISASARIDQIAVLQSKSDAELAKMGIKRESIVHHVFNDLYYT